MRQILSQAGEKLRTEGRTDDYHGRTGNAILVDHAFQWIGLPVDGHRNGADQGAREAKSQIVRIIGAEAVQNSVAHATADALEGTGRLSGQGEETAASVCGYAHGPVRLDPIEEEEGPVRGLKRWLIVAKGR